MRGSRLERDNKLVKRESAELESVGLSCLFLTSSSADEPKLPLS